MKTGTKMKKRVHTVWKELDTGRRKKVRVFVGEPHCVYSSRKGEISLVQITNYHFKDIYPWEITCLKGNLFEDIERFKSKKEAVKRIRKLLEK